jgi:aminomethyltransferase
MSSVRATPFHSRAADANPGNRWAARNRFTLASSYDGAQAEAAAARFAVAMADISWRWRVMLEGPRAHTLVQRLFTRDAGALEPGQALKTLWLGDGGGVRGAGVVARYGRESFQLIAAEDDAEWIASAAELFGIVPRDMTEEDAGLALIGPYAARLVAALGLDELLDLLCFRKVFWRGLDLTVTRFGELNGYEIWCKADDALLLWDRVARAGADFGVVLAGLEAQDILDIETGVPRPGRDYDGARAATAAEPLAGEWRLAKLIDAEHTGFNGAAAALAAVPRRRLVGLVFDSMAPAPFATVLAGNAVVGRTLSACVSPGLKRAIALAQVDEAHAAPGTAFSVAVPGSRTQSPTVTAARVTDLPFLPTPDPIEA